MYSVCPFAIALV